MVKKIPKTIEFRVEPYKCLVFAGTDKKALEQRIKAHIKKHGGKECKSREFHVHLPPLCEGGGAYTTELADGVYAVLYGTLDPGFCAHEAVHLKNMIFSHIGQNPTHMSGSDETESYLVESLFNNMYLGLQGKKPEGA